MNPTVQPPENLATHVISQAQIRTYFCSYRNSSEGYELKSRTVPDYNFIFILAGRAVWMVQGQENVLFAGSLIVVPPQAEHHAYSQTQKITLVSLHVEAHLPNGQDIFRLLNAPSRLQLSKNSRLHAYLKMAAEEFNRPVPHERRLIMRGWGELTVREFFIYSARHNLLKADHLNPLIPAILLELEKYISQPVIRLDTLSNRVGFSPQYLNRIFRKALGITPLQYLMRMKMNRAADFLRQGTWTIQEIAARVGMQDPYYFSRCFKQIYKQSPARFRQLSQTN